MRGIVWFRRDLRLHDNPALDEACNACSHVIPLFVFDEPLLRSQTFGSACVNFMLGCLEDLAASFGARRVSLQWRRGEPLEEVVNAARDWKADVVYWNRDYEPGAIRRDRAVQQRLAELGVRAQTFKDHAVFEAEEVRGATGEPLQRYSAYRARWWSRWWATKAEVLPISGDLRKDTSLSLSSPTPIPTARELGYEPITPWIEPGERNARRALIRFLDEPMHRYANGRNLPAIEGTSKLSPHFRFGTMSPRTAIHAALAVLAAGGRVSRVDVLTWIDEMIWREFFQQVLSAFPRVVDGPFRAGGAPPREPGPERDQLHNRVRMIVASFLIKDLRIDWQSGERYFMRHLLDADTAANNGNWQWCASTGTDAMRGYRILNPALQSKKFDPDGSYIRRYVPELNTVSHKWVHEPHLMPPDEQSRTGCRIGVDYAAPIVDHRHARQEYLDLGKRQVTP